MVVKTPNNKENDKSAIFLFFFFFFDINDFIYLLEENRNLCEDEQDKAECIREVEEAKGNHDSTEQQGASMKSYPLDL